MHLPLAVNLYKQTQSHMDLFNRNLKHLMLSKGISNEDLAHNSGLELSEINAIVDGKSQAVSNQIPLIADALGFAIEPLMRIDLQQQDSVFKGFNCKLLALDVDGVMTDGGMLINSDGTETKKFNTRDGMAIKMALKAGIEVAFISSGLNIDLIRYRAEMLGVKRVWVGRGPKLPILESYCNELEIGFDSVAYIGDDINDIEILQKVGLGACPADASKDVLQIASLVLLQKGGKGCVRELAERLGWIPSYI